MEIIEDKPEDLNNRLKQGTPTFVFFYLNGCKPCEDTTEEWTKMKERLENKRGSGDDFVVARAESELIPKVEGKNGKKFNVNSFPSIHFVSSSGQSSEFDGPDRSVDSFISWVNKNAPQQDGGNKQRRRTRRRERKTKRRRRGTSRRRKTHKR